MLGEPAADWRSERREAARAEILRAASALAREHGLTGWTLRDLARRLGMAAPSLYSYFPAKDALYDAMFAQGNREVLAREWPRGRDLRETLELGARVYADFCCEDPVRYQLLYQRTIPGFVPSEESWALAEQAYEQMVAPLREHGLTAQDLDLVTGVYMGLIAQQLANDPDGDRWTRLIGTVTELLHRHFSSSQRSRPAPPRRRSTTTPTTAPTTTPNKRTSS